MRRPGLLILAVIALAAAAAPRLAPHAADQQVRGWLSAPPTWPHVVDDQGRWHAPFIYPWRVISRLEQRYEQDRSMKVPLRWLSGGRLLASSDESRAPLMLLGTDSFGRDVFARLLYGARTSLGLALAAAAGALLIGSLIGGMAGYGGALMDETLMRASDFVLVLPAMYVALALRSVLPLVLPAGVVFVLLVSIFAVLGAPLVARGVRTIVRTEKQRDYSVAAVSIGAGHARLLLRHLLPAARGFLAVQLVMLVPAFVVAEATLSYVGLGFPEPVASWGTMLRDAASVRTFVDFPWLLTPAAAMFVVVLAMNLVHERAGGEPLSGLAERLHYNRARQTLRLT
jgi:peptide/nickel transport system permease protein